MSAGSRLTVAYYPRFCTKAMQKVVRKKASAKQSIFVIIIRDWMRLTPVVMIKSYMARYDQQSSRHRFMRLVSFMLLVLLNQFYGLLRSFADILSGGEL